MFCYWYNHLSYVQVWVQLLLTICSQIRLDLNSYGLSVPKKYHFNLC